MNSGVPPASTWARLRARVIANSSGTLLVPVQLSLLGSFAIVALIVGSAADSAGIRTQLLLGLALIVVSAAALCVPWASLPDGWILLVAVVDIVIVAQIRVAVVNEQPGVNVLVLIPVLWLAYSFGIVALLLAIMGDFFAAVLPYALSGDWPATSAQWAGTTILPATIAIVAIAVFVAARQQRRERADLVAAYEDLRVSIAEGLDTASAALAVVDTVDAGITFYNPAGEILLTNDTARQLAVAGGSPASTAVQRWEHVFGEDRVTPIPEDQRVVALAARGEIVTRRLFWIGVEADQRAVVVSTQFVRRASGELIGTVVAAHDVTPLAEAIYARDEFLTTITHELRTPLTSMIGYLDLIEDSVDLADSGLAAEFGIVQRNSQRLLALINDLLVTTRGQAHLERRLFDVAALAENSINTIRVAAAEAGVHIVPPTLVPVRAEVDADQIGNVLDKVLSNALKFNRPEGEIDLTIEVDGDDVVIRVGDTGIGMSEPEQAQIFDRFFRGASSRLNVIAGSGLGLSTAKTIVEAHHGSISVQSELGEGSTIEIRLPLRVGSPVTRSVPMVPAVPAVPAQTLAS
ncbi:HAMP domain-containing histidine kinase [Cryobacterium algoricola]|uniref:histidine kinase n=1 Tax=Cryobacterium algoricola TaxID=1259183 RepID=A0ABY2ICD1_9MICO|nr:HAMP domain-containing sensor histidine kinase [Cryobacterium algoricola]TFB87246.1 HAMP domain-containing histidine kinase [Cryobacterium algoricola]